MPSLRFVNAEEVVEFEGHLDLIEMDDYIAFGCRSGKCGMCAVRIVSGDDNLSPRTPNEEQLFALIGEGDPAMRLACQSRAHGDIVLFEIN